MKAKTYKAASIQQALDQIKSELGSDAMILSTQKLVGRSAFGLIRRNFWEVTAAASEAPTSNLAPSQNPLLRFSEAAPQRSPERPTPRISPPRAVVPLPEVTTSGSPRPQNNDIRFEKLLDEVDGLKKTLQFIRRTIPVPARDMNGVYGELVNAGFTPEAADDIIAEASKANPDADELRDRVREVLAEKFIVETPVEFLAKARTISVFVGPTGSGKTSAIAKIAGHAKARFRKNVTVISMDTFRIGGQDQLAAYASLMDIPAYTCPDVASLKRLVRSLDDDLILIDTPGLSPAEHARRDAVKAVTEIPDARVHAVFSAATRPDDMERFLAAFPAEQPIRIVLSKIDEVESVNPLLAHAAVRELAISFVTDGPNVPEDLSVHTANDFAAAILPESTAEEVEADS